MPWLRCSIALAAVLGLRLLPRSPALASGTFETGDPVIHSVELPGLGRVRGTAHRDAATDELTYQFIGLPYAAQPVSRFEPSRLWPSNLSYPNGTWDATAEVALPPVCPQLAAAGGGVVGSEDCLYLNIFTPPRATEAGADAAGGAATAGAPGAPGAAAAAGTTGPKKELRPVMVFIHGGSYILGGISSPDYNGQYLSSARGVVVVSLAYRLGALGFLAHPAMEPKGALGNLGLLDLKVGLEWVHRYIEHFNGDPKRITLVGQSAGAYLACLHMLMPESRGYLSAVVMESGGCYAQPLDLALERSQRFAEAVGCGGIDADDAGEDQLGCLKRLPLEALVNASTALGQASYHYWQPTVEGATTLPASPAQLLGADARLRKRLPVIVGTNEDEGSLFLPATGLGDDDSDDAYVEWVTGGAMLEQEGFPLLTEEEARAVLHLYPPAGPGRNRQNAANIIADAHYKCPTAFVARMGWSSLHLYRFKYFQQACDSRSLGVYHGSELPYLWGHPHLCPCHAPVFTEEEYALSSAMQTYWTNLMSGGRGPNVGPAGEAGASSAVQRRRGLRGGGSEGAAIPFWPPFRGLGMLQLDAGNITWAGLDRRELEACAFWDTTRVYR